MFFARKESLVMLRHNGFKHFRMQRELCDGSKSRCRVFCICIDFKVFVMISVVCATLYNPNEGTDFNKILYEAITREVF